MRLKYYQIFVKIIDELLSSSDVSPGLNVLSGRWNYIWLKRFPYTSSAFRGWIWKLHIYKVTKMASKSLLFVRHFITAMVRLFSSLCGNCLRHLIFCIFTENLKSYIILNLRPRKRHIYVFRKLFSFRSFWASASCI